MSYKQMTVEKLNRYRHEAEVYRSLPRTAWRVRVAANLHALANRLEPRATPKVGGQAFS